MVGCGACAIGLGGGIARWDRIGEGCGGWNGNGNGIGIGIEWFWCHDFLGASWGCWLLLGAKRGFVLIAPVNRFLGGGALAFASHMNRVL